jgi:glycosyltransferase involved in cell wall biosynthesis
MVVLHGSDVPHYQDERFGLLYQLTKPWTRLIWRNAQRVVAVSSGLRDLALRSWPAGKIMVIPNGVDTERFSPAKERKPVLGPLRIVVNAQLIKRKGIHVLLRALASLPMTLRAEWSLRVFGVGPYAHVLQRLAGQLALSDRVSFCGLVPYADIPARLREADLFILPSLQEGMPLALLEAMACGLPVLSTEVGAIPGIVRDHGNGRLVKPGDEAGLATVLAEMLPQRQRLVEMGRVARETAMRWSWEMIWSRYEVLAEESLSATGSS